MKKLVLLALLFLSLGTKSQVKDADHLYLLDLFEAQRYIEASQYLKKMYPEPITDKKLLSRFGYSLRMAGKFSEAEKYYTRILEQDSTELPALFSIASINQAKGNYAKATEYYKLILEIDSNNFSVYKQLSNLIEVSVGLVFAAEYLQRANEINPADGEVAYSLSKVLKEGELLESAEKVLDVAIAADSSNLILLRGKAEIAYAAKNWPVVIEMCNKLIREGDQGGNILKMLGQAYYYIKKYDRAIEILTGLEESKMESESIMYFIALSYKNLKNYPKAIEYFNKTLKESISPNAAEYYVQIGDVNEKNNQIRQSLSAYQKSLFFESKPLTLYSMATIYDQKLKDPKTALTYYKKYLNTNPPKNHTAYIDYSKYRIAELSK